MFKTKRTFSIYLFDWGDTLMVDIPFSKGPMKDWPIVKAVQGAQETLEHLNKVSNCYLVTNAKDSNEKDIKEALVRVNLDTFLSGIFCYRNIGFEKPSSKFFLNIISIIGCDPKDSAMVGNSFEKDILGANKNGIFGYWYNPNSSEFKQSKMYTTIHSLKELI